MSSCITAFICGVGRKSMHVMDALLTELFVVVGPGLFGPCSNWSSRIYSSFHWFLGFSLFKTVRRSIKSKKLAPFFFSSTLPSRRPYAHHAHTQLTLAQQEQIDNCPTNSITMIPFIPTLALAFVSFIASAFVILRIVIPILPPHPLSRRVPPVRCVPQGI